MSWARANPVLFLMLVFLLAGDIGSSIFADAGTLTCSYWWQRPDDNNGHRHQCAVDNNGVPTYYTCNNCGRPDTKSPTAADCVEANGRPLSTKGSFNCDAGVTNNPEANKARPIICLHLMNGVPTTFYCKTRRLHQQCPSDQCKERTYDYYKV